jgi:hypothetical protein
MKPPKRSKPVVLRRSPSPDGEPLPPRSRLLLLEAQELTRWSIATYLRRWYVVETPDSSAAARRLVQSAVYAALVLSDEFARSQLLLIQRIAAERNPALKTVYMVTGARDVTPLEGHTHQLEKPFELPSLARLLGVPQHELAAR